MVGIYTDKFESQASNSDFSLSTFIMKNKMKKRKFKVSWVCIEIESLTYMWIFEAIRIATKCRNRKKRIKKEEVY